MLPNPLAQDLQNAVHDFLHTAFPISTRWFQRGAPADAPDTLNDDPQALIQRLTDDPNALFKGPYLQIRLPFRQAAAGVQPFARLKLPFVPYAHQMRAFERLAGDAPSSTLVATGTGSGKTECFMLPVLDHCLAEREKGKKGIKAIIIYPMNALAADQARRFASEVTKLTPKLAVGLFVGMEQKNAETGMGPEHVITHQDTLRRNPPDILLTNYKMLDYLLIRPRDRGLWQHNLPGRLRYLVVDELHTFDGAQGTDLACLIRRLRARLGAGSELTCVGTSATLGSGAGPELLAYAQDVFATQFDAGAVIGEDRLSAGEYLQTLPQEGELPVIPQWPQASDPGLCATPYRNDTDYLNAQIKLWFGPGPGGEPPPQLPADSGPGAAQSTVQLGQLLGRHPAFHALIQDLHAHDDQRPIDLRDLAAAWRQKLQLDSDAQALALLDSLGSLVAAARCWADSGDADTSNTRPFLEVRQQLWLRELRRMVCLLPGNRNALPRLAFADDLRDPNALRDHEGGQYLPLLHCRHCHLAAWGAVHADGDQHLKSDLQTFYRHWFGPSTLARLMVPMQADEARAQGRTLQGFCPACRLLQNLPTNDNSCSECKHAHLLHVWVPDMVREVQRGGQRQPEGHRDCPSCGSRDSLAVVGYRAVTLASVMAGRLFSSPWNNDHKLIAFSDSVQDAAHRAGFMGASTWRQVVRQAMSAWLAQQHGPVPLRDMQARLPEWWRGQLPSAAHFCGLFIAPNMQWLRDYAALVDKGKLPPDSDLAELVAKRLGWECLLEFGSRSRVGRALERVGAASVGLDSEQLQQDAARLATRLREEVQGLRDASDAAFLRFVTGWLTHMRQTGAIYDAVLDIYLANKGKEFLLNSKKFSWSRWLPGFGKRSRPPAAVTLGHVAANFEALTLASRSTWASNWLKKTLGAEDHPFAAAEPRQIFQLSLQTLTRAGWLVERDCAGASVYLLNPERLQVTAHSLTAHCRQCGWRLAVAPAAAFLFDGLPCLRDACTGQLQVEPEPAPPPKWGAGQPRRLVPHEHTSLLDADKRQQVEQSFIAGSQPWDINLLSATPTLEMGIDIGTLSTVLLCSVPPTQANYLQRIGRAGRRDGNALALTVANGRDHDLYFNAEPMEMMAGQVHTPGVFLQATAVLERQLIAYCLDRWVMSGVDDQAIPGQLRQALDAVQHQQRNRFPYTLCAFVEAGASGLLQDFFALFDTLDDDARQHLAAFLQGAESDGASMAWRLVNRLQEVVQQRTQFKKKAEQLKTERARLQQQPQDEETQEQIRAMDDERRALLALVWRTNKQLTLNFMTDEGLLPNYAFPEAGVTLQSVILRRLPPGGADSSSQYEKLSHSFQRPAQAALSELAPDNRFYAVSHKLPIDRIDLVTSQAEQWRFCDRCHYNEAVDAGDVHSACPRCGSAQWADSGQKRAVLKLRQVYSTVSDRDSRISDDSEQREPVFYNRQMLLDTPPDAQAGGWRIADEQLPFGFEFLRRVTLREVNFGNQGDQGDNFRVAGQEHARPGFHICRHCGKVQKKRWRHGERPHDFTCPISKDPARDGPEAYLDSLYLYRELESEAIRILLPLSEVAYSDEKLHSLVAALNLGLKEYFHGNVHHLEVTDVRMPAAGSVSECVFLVVYDRIPGGTGYLKELMSQPGNMKQVFDLALQRLQDCGCAFDETKDGCYRCIYAYRDSRHMKTISRRAAMQLLRAITSRWELLEPVSTLADINTNTLTESALEQKFLDTLARLDGAKLLPTLVHGSAGYLLTLPGADGHPVAWQIEQQRRVGPADGVQLSTDIDFVLWPVREKDKQQHRPIAVYTDGLQYHRDIVADDVAKRSALLLSGRFWVWSMGWDDLPDAGQDATPLEASILQAQGPAPATAGIFDRLAQAAGWEHAAAQTAKSGWGTLQWLETLLRNPVTTATACTPQAVFRTLTTLAPQTASNTQLRQAMQDELQACAPPQLLQRLALTHTDQLAGGFMAALGNARPGLTLAASLPRQALRTADAQAIAAALRVHLHFDDGAAARADADAFKAAWRNFWHAANLLQYVPGFSMSTQQAVADGRLKPLWAAALAAPSAAGQDDQAAAVWPEVLELSELPAAQIEALAALGLPEPELGLDIVGADGVVAISGSVAELVWPEQRVAVVMSQLAAANAPAGWQLLLADDGLTTNMGQLLAQGVFS